MPRLFTALEVPYSIAMPLSLLRSKLPGARWVEEENYHITLRFFGDVENHIADEIVHMLSRIEQAPFSLQLQGLDVFGSKKPRVLYARVMPCETLNALHASIERIAQKLHLSSDKVNFVPHVTLAHFTQVKLDDLAQYLSSHGYFKTETFHIDRFVLMSSKESVGGGPYIIEEKWPLHAKT